MWFDRQKNIKIGITKVCTCPRRRVWSCWPGNHIQGLSWRTTASLQIQSPTRGRGQPSQPEIGRHAKNWMSNWQWTKIFYCIERSPLNDILFWKNRILTFYWGKPQIIFFIMYSYFKFHIDKGQFVSISVIDLQSMIEIHSYLITLLKIEVKD